MDKYYIISLKKAKNKTYIINDEGYPGVRVRESPELHWLYCSFDRIKRNIEIYEKFNLWCSEIGFTKDNIQIEEITLHSRIIGDK